MANKLLNTPKINTRTITEVQLTAMTIDFENTVVEAHYITIDSDGVPYQRGSTKADGNNSVNGLFQLIVNQNANTGAELKAALEQVLLNRIDVEIG